MKKALTLISLAPLLVPMVVAMLVPAVAQAQIFVCKDGAGRTLTADREIAECRNQLMREMDRTGVTRREIAPPLTAEQKRQKEEDDKKRKAEEAAALEQRNSDNALRTRFRNEQDIALARKRALDVLQERLKDETAAQSVLDARRKAIQVELDKLAAARQPVPADVASNLNEVQKAQAAQRTKVVELELELYQVSAKFDATAKRLKELSGVQSAQNK